MQLSPDENDCVGMLVRLSLSSLLFIAVSTGEGKNLSITEREKIKIKNIWKSRCFVPFVILSVCFVFSCH